jgi:hypothetical protein
MDHQPFEEWLLENQPLTNDQQRQLNTHLRTCSSCTAMAEVNLALKSVRIAGPADGFKDRFQSRLIARKQALQRRNFWGFVVLTFFVLGILIWVSLPWLKEIFHEPVNLMASWFSSLVSFWTSFQGIFRAGLVLFKVIPGFSPVYILAVIMFAAGGWSFVWVLSLMKFTRKPQGV